MKLQRLPSNWFSWKDYGIIILRRWSRYCEGRYSVILSQAIDWCFEKTNDGLMLLLCIPLLLIAVATVSFDLAVVSAKKMLGISVSKDDTVNVKGGEQC